MRYNGSALYITSEQSREPYPFNSTSRYYYSTNGTSYSCTSNFTANYTCQPASVSLNLSTFGLSTFLGLLSVNAYNLSDVPATVSNSSYNGIPCLATYIKVSNSTESSGATLSITDTLSGCIQPVYKVPLELNISAVGTESGSYPNGTVMKPETVTLGLNLHLTNLTNSSSPSEVENLPANALIVGQG
jgi:hypothetical protein